MALNVYILKNQKGSFYIGHSGNFQDRLNSHNSNKVFSTKNRGPWQPVHQKRFNSRAEAVRYERYLKSLKGGIKFKKIVDKG